MNSKFKKRVTIGTCAIAVTLFATAPLMLPQSVPPLQQICPVCEPTEQSRVMPHPLAQAPSVELVSPKTDTQMPPLPEVVPKLQTELPLMLKKPLTPQLPPPTQAAQTPAPPDEPKMGDTRTVDGQKQVYFLGFGWIEDNDAPNECIYAEDMYENGNKVGRMGGGTFVNGDGDINKMVGIMGGQIAEGCSESELMTN